MMTSPLLSIPIEKHEGSVRESADAGAIGRTSLLLARAHKGESNIEMRSSQRISWSREILQVLSSAPKSRHAESTILSRPLRPYLCGSGFFCRQ
jgi:hypothetical protein